jgi:hypothetical protein
MIWNEDKTGTPCIDYTAALGSDSLETKVCLLRARSRIGAPRGWMWCMQLRQVV